MTLAAHMLVGEDRETAVDFPAPGFKVRPRTLSLSIRRLLDEDHTQNRAFVYPDIGFDANAARHIRVAASKTGEETDPVDGMTFQRHWWYTKGLGLELIAGLFLSVLDSPQSVYCASHVGMIGEMPVPHTVALQGEPDGRADFGEFVILNEVTTVRHLNEGDIEGQWDSAETHVAQAEVTDRQRIYCFMVSRLGLDGRDGKKPKRKWQLAALAEAQEKHEAPETTKAAVKFLVFNFEDVSEIALKLDRLYCDPDRRGKPRALTEEALGRILDRLHDMAMEQIAAGKDFGIGWAAETFNEMLDNHAKGHPIEGKPPKDGKKA